jgi:hypothetical protein
MDMFYHFSLLPFLPAVPDTMVCTCQSEDEPTSATAPTPPPAAPGSGYAFDPDAPTAAETAASNASNSWV